jgi:hypothetical protein
MFFFYLLGGGGGGGFENFTCLKRGATKKYYNCRVSPQSSPVQ